MIRKLAALIVVLFVTLAFSAPVQAGYFFSEEQLKQLESLLKLSQPILAEETPNGTPIMTRWVEIGKRYQPRYVAYFVKRGDDIYWKLEEFELRPDGNFLMTAWVFRPHAAVKFTALVLTPSGTNIGDGEPGGVYSTNDAVAIERSEFTQRLLLKAKGWM